MARVCEGEAQTNEALIRKRGCRVHEREGINGASIAENRDHLPEGDRWVETKLQERRGQLIELVELMGEVENVEGRAREKTQGVLTYCS